MNHLLEFIGLTDWSSFLVGWICGVLIGIVVIVEMGRYLTNLPKMDEREDEYGHS